MSETPRTRRPGAFCYSVDYQTTTGKVSTVSPVPSTDYPLLDFTATDGCELHLANGTANGSCIQCLRDKYTAHFAREDYAEWALWERMVEDEVTWLLRRVKDLARQRHNGDEWYYFAGHPEMTRPPTPKRGKRTIAGKQRTRILERDQYRCRTCGSWHDLTIDHILPESRGGSDDDDNLQALCRPCNLSKGARTQDEWEAAL